MEETDARRRRADGVGGEHVLLLALGQDAGSGEPRDQREAHQRRRHTGVVDPLSQEDGDGQGEQQAREGQDRVEQPAQDRVDLPAPETCHPPKPGAEEPGNDCRRQAGRQRQAGPEQASRQDVPAELVRAEPEARTGRQKLLAAVLAIGLVGADPRCQEYGQAESRQQDEARQAGTMPQETPPAGARTPVRQLRPAGGHVSLAGSRAPTGSMRARG